MVKASSIPRYGGRGAGAIWLLQQRFNHRGDENEAPRDTDTKRSIWKVTFLDPNQLSASVANRIAMDSPILKVALASFFLGATTSFKPKKRGKWEYRPQWVCLEAAKARKAMEAAYNASRQVLVLSLPALVFHMEDAALLVAELNTNEPFRRAFDMLKPTYAGRPTRSTKAARFQPGPFRPSTLRDAVEFFLVGATAATKKSWLFALTSSPMGRKEGRAFPPPALVYTMAIRSYAKKPDSGSRLAANVKLADLRWTHHTLGTSDETRTTARGKPTDNVRDPPDKPLDTYVRQLVALSVPSR